MIGGEIFTFIFFVVLLLPYARFATKTAHDIAIFCMLAVACVLGLSCLAGVVNSVYKIISLCEKRRRKSVVLPENLYYQTTQIKMHKNHIDKYSNK
jgi:aspartokinase-like uncharacterized kinase